MSDSAFRICTSVCCNRKAVIPSESQCFWNTSFFAEGRLLPDIDCWDELIPITTHQELDSLCKEPEDSDLENDFYSMLEFGINHIDNPTKHRLAQRLGTEDYNCSISYIIANGTQNGVATCDALFDLDFSSIEELDAVTTASDIGDAMLYHHIMLGISLPCFAATFLIYTIIPELRNLHGLILRNYIACAFIAYTAVIIPKTDLSPILGGFLGLIELYSGLATFFWLNVMCFDIWWTFRTLKHSSKQRSRKRRIIYSIYAWGLPSLMIVIYSCLVLADSIPDNVLLYLVVPVAVTVFSNLSFFILTSIHIVQHKKDTAEGLDRSESRRHNEEKQRFNVHLKLFTIMGIGWVADWSMSFLDQPVDTWVVYIIYILQLPALLQGIAIFIMFVCTEKIKQLLSKRLGWSVWEDPKFLTLQSRQTLQTAVISQMTQQNQG